MYIRVHPVITLVIPLSLSAKTTSAAIIPRYIAMPPNLGIGFLCMRLSSFGMSIAPILGAIFIAAGVTAAATTKATRSGPHNSMLVAVT